MGPLLRSAITRSAAVICLLGLSLTVNAATAAADGSIMVSPIMDFGQVPLGEQRSATFNVFLEPMWTGPVTISAVEVVGTDAGDYSVTEDECTGVTFTHPFGVMQCQGVVTFTPTETGPRSAALSIVSDAFVSPLQTPLTGTGENPEACGLLEELAFWSARVGTTVNASEVLLLRNCGHLDLHVETVAIEGPNADDFALTQDTCTGATLPPFVNPVADACVLAATFTPSGEGLRTATIRIFDDAPGSPHEVSLHGYGYLPTLTIVSDTILTGNYQGHVVVAVDGVTLDCAGFDVIGAGTGDGIRLENRTSVTVKNCNVSGFSWGITLVGSTGNQVLDNVAHDNSGNGFNAVASSDGNRFRGNESLDNGANGFIVHDSVANVLVGNRGSGNLTGVQLYFADDNTIVRNSLVDNVDLGYWLISSSGNVLRGNAARDNGGGVYLTDGSMGNLVEENVAASNTEDGFIAGGGSDGNHFRGNIASDSGSAGFTIDESNGNTLVQNRSRANAWVGVAVRSARGNTLRANILEDNVSEGINLERSDVNEVLGNISRRNGLGLAMYASSGNVFTDNRFLDNGPEGWGVWVADHSNDNRFVGNLAQGNAWEGFAIAEGSSGNLLLGNVSKSNDYEGISLYFGADHNVVRANVLGGNRTSGILVVESSYNLIANNTSLFNNWAELEDSAGISVIQGSSHNRITRNVACQNGHVDGYDDHSGAGNAWIANTFCRSEI